MPAVLKTVIEKFLVPYMNVCHITGAYFVSNRASRRVFEKSGFVLEEELPDLIELAESKTGVKGKKVGLGSMRWERKLS